MVGPRGKGLGGQAEVGDEEDGVGELRIDYTQGGIMG